MAHQCVHCGKIFETPSREIFEGCSCGSHFFFFIKPEQYEKLKDGKMPVVELSEPDKKKVEEEVREIMGAEDEEIPVILDLESVSVKGPGKFVIDVVSLFDKKKPLIYKLEEGKYIIDLSSCFRAKKEDINRKIRNPEKNRGKWQT